MEADEDFKQALAEARQLWKTLCPHEGEELQFLLRDLAVLNSLEDLAKLNATSNCLLEFVERRQIMLDSLNNLAKFNERRKNLRENIERGVRNTNGKIL